MYPNRVKMLAEFFGKHLDKFYFRTMCKNANIPVEFFEKFLDKVDWHSLGENNFSHYFDNLEIKENKNILSKVHYEINTFIYSHPSNSFSYLPKGGYGYLEMLSKYDF